MNNDPSDEQGDMACQEGAAHTAACIQQARHNGLPTTTRHGAAVQIAADPIDFEVDGSNKSIRGLRVTVQRSEFDLPGAAKVARDLADQRGWKPATPGEASGLLLALREREPEERPKALFVQVLGHNGSTKVESAVVRGESAFEPAPSQQAAPQEFILLVEPR